MGQQSSIKSNTVGKSHLRSHLEQTNPERQKVDWWLPRARGRPGRKWGVTADGYRLFSFWGDKNV